MNAFNDQIKQSSEWQDWHWQLNHRISGPQALMALLDRHEQCFDCQALEAVAQRYRFGAVPYYLQLIDWNDPLDPIRLQCIPAGEELVSDSACHTDPFGECANTPVPGVIHRFADRVLWVVSTDCAMICRHCTRKNTLDGPGLVLGNLDAALDYLRSDKRIREVILSGGDPLLLETDRLDDILSAVQAVPHIEAVRIGTRVPAVLPMRIDDALVDMLRKHHPVWLNTQFNHPRELTPDAMTACERLVDGGIPVSNQTVLLRHVNDTLPVMRELCCGLQRHRVRPYYVFLCDPVQGISHFRVARSVAATLQENLRTSVGGLCLPRFVEDLPGEWGKKMIGCDHG